ncbi:MAG: PKD domain-containing protein, partial [Desulfuromonadaceae bacterium]
MLTMKKVIKLGLWAILSSLLLACAAAAGTAQYTYDGLNRLVQVQYEDGTVIQYTYDAAGNCLVEQVSAATPGGTPPVAEFTAAPYSGAAPLAVQFTDASTGNINTRTWDFGDGSGSSSASPSHTYQNPGTYTATLTVSGLGGTSSRSATITATPPPPVADFTAAPNSGLPPLAVQFTDASTGNINTRTWDFGDGSGSSSASPSHTYQNGGTFTATLTVSGPGGTSSKSTTITAIIPPPVVNFTATPNSGTAPLAVQFTDASTGNINTRTWDFGDNSGSTDPSPKHTYNPGTYTVTLTVTGIGGTNSKSAIITVIAPPPPVAHLSVWPNSGSAPLAVEFGDHSTGNRNTRSWDFGDGSSDSGLYPSHTYQNPGTYTATLTVTGLGGTDSMSTTITVTATGNNFASDYNCKALWLFESGDLTYDTIGSNYLTASSPTPPTADTVNFREGAASAKFVAANSEFFYIADADLDWGFPFSRNGTTKVGSFCFWYLPGSTTDWQYLISKSKWDGITANAAFSLIDRAGTLYVEWGQGGENWNDTSTGLTFTVGTWYHIGCTIDDSGNVNVVVYNWSTGNTASWFNAFGSAPYITDNDFGIGERMGAQGLSTGNLDEVVVFNRILSLIEIEEIRNGTFSGPNAPVAFTAVPSSGTAPLAVQFTDTSTGNINTWAWDFGDGSSSSSPSPSHTYQNPGTYTAMLTVTGSGGTWSKRAIITVIPPPPVANFTAAPNSGTAPLAVQFTDTSTGSISSWTWDFGDGSGSSSASPSHTYQNPGTYTATLTVSGTGGNNSKSATITVTVPPPVANFTAVPTSGPAPLALQFTDASTGSINSWTWDFGDGSGSSSASPSHTYQNPGTYTATLTVSGPGGTNSKSATITVNTPPPVANFTAVPSSGPA